MRRDDEVLGKTSKNIRSLAPMPSDSAASRRR